jgi:hypothetical protein
VDKIDGVKDIFYEELEHMFDHVPKYHMTILLGNFNAEVCKEGTNGLVKGRYT